MRYRADIDGLRALAVIPVLLYHVGVPGFAGGFVGVDIFFVISGYLICGMIDADLREGSFSLGNFYKRRILRILPALFVMFLVTSILAYVYCLPVELEEYSRSLASAVGSISNIYFAATAGYFDAPAETKPLLHTWSLGVEEQFYLIAPLLMLLAYRFLPKRAKLLFAIARRAFLCRGRAGELSEPRPSHFISRRFVHGSWRSARCFRSDSFRFRKPDSSRNLCGVTGMLLVLGAMVFGSLIGSASGCDLRCQRRLDSAHRFQRTRPFNGWKVVVAATSRFHRPDILFALSVALAADRLSTHRRIAGRRRIEHHDRAGADHGLDRHRLPVMEIRRVAVPGEGEGYVPKPRCSASPRPR